MLKTESLKKKTRREKFQKIGKAISALKPQPHFDDRDYYTGKESKFHFAIADALQREGYRLEVPLGPEFKTPQWVRTVKDFDR